MTEAPTQIKFEGKLLDLVALETVNTAPPEVQEYMTHLQIEIAKAFRVPDRYLMPPDVDREFQQRMWDAKVSAARKAYWAARKAHQGIVADGI